ncbi:exodeoxyribonuclease VII large subunit [Sedimentimonas flavescens]|uniref:Exodeoxyribonuclease 7 large subunit n=1 Tax=Sedimentimonas flavescens TaxID=2851012 RepID=A0ABT2ZWR9_9RHOB|nr:exodeoxyribonuclease VII large subunit [Sedimentimonas flavescens]MCV2878198.1 exodeoxyribonuclease VII large subunit [Sedimentimonas flavescens]
MDLLDETPGSNAHDYSVSEISGAVKRVIEGEFGRVRVRGEVGRVSRPSSGHLYFDLKDDRAVIAAVSWKGQVARMQVRPEEGMEVIATGKLTTFPGQSKYQLIVDDVEPAGAGALMAMLEARRKALAAEGLFDAARKRSLPYLPEVIGVVTSPSGAVIRDILHRLRDRFPRRVLIWPVAVQGQACAPEVTAAIRGFNALPEGGPIPRPDLLIVARGGGSIEDLWGFNEESVVRAAAESRIPLISAVGHETDTTLIDFASDRRAPTPTAAAEMAVPVRSELAARLAEAEARMARATRGRLDQRGQRLSDLSRALGRPDALLQPARQRFDLMSDRLSPALRMVTTRKRALFAPLEARIAPHVLRRFMAEEARRLAGLAGRLAPALARTRADAERQNRLGRAQLDSLGERLQRAPHVRFEALAERLERLDRMRQTLGYRETLRRGYAVVRAGEDVVTSKAAAAAHAALEIEFHDGRLRVVTGTDAPPTPQPAPKPARAKKPEPPNQGSLF